MRGIGPPTVEPILAPHVTDTVMEASNLRCLLITVQGGQAILPSSVVVEVLPFASPLGIETAPHWVIGAILWRNLTTPLVSLGRLIFRVQPESDINSRIIIVNTLGNDSRLPYFGIVQENTPTPKKEAKVEKLAETMPESAKVLRALTGKPQEASIKSENVLEALTLLHEDDYKEIPESERTRVKALREAYIDSKHPQHTKAVKALHELLNQEN